MGRRRKRDEIGGAAIEIGGEFGGTLLAEFPPAAIALGVVAGVSVLSFLAWKMMAAKKRVC